MLDGCMDTHLKLADSVPKLMPLQQRGRKLETPDLRYLSRRQYAQEILGDLAHHQLEPHIADAVDVTWASIFNYLGQTPGGHAVVSSFRHDAVA